MSPDFERDGAELYSGLAGSCIDAIAAIFGGQNARPGRRITNLGDLRPLFAADGPIGSAAAQRLGSSAKPVRAITFDKTDQVNWSLGWHQDRIISVRSKVAVAGFGPWTVKQGVTHVQPPFELLERMITIRIHLDAVDDGNAPLKIALGSHRLGRVEERDITAVVARCGQASCFAEIGDVWLYSTPIVHASDKALAARKRRVLQIDYSADELPGDLAWLEL